MTWLARLGLKHWAGRRWQRCVRQWGERSRAVMTEASMAAEDRLALARLEWLEHKRRLLFSVALAAALGVLMVATLLLLALAVLLQLWDTPQRMLVVWLLVVACALACGAVYGLLRAALQRTDDAFALTRRELANDWQALKERLQELP